MGLRTFAVKGPNGKTFTSRSSTPRATSGTTRTSATTAASSRSLRSSPPSPSSASTADGIVIARHAHPLRAPTSSAAGASCPTGTWSRSTTRSSRRIREAVGSHGACRPRGRRGARPPVQRRAPRHVPQRRGAAAAWLRAYGWPRRPPARDDRDRRRLRRSPDHLRARTAASPTPTGSAPSSSALEERFGGVGLYFMTGLGNMSNSAAAASASRLADLIPDVGEWHPSREHRRRRTRRRPGSSPATNVPLTALGMPGFFDRKFLHAARRAFDRQEPRHGPVPVGVAGLGRDAGERDPHRERVRAHRRHRARSSPTSPTPSRRSPARS